MRTQDFIGMRKVAYRSTRRYVEGKGYRLDQDMFEDAFQAAMLAFYEQKDRYFQRWVAGEKSKRTNKVLRCPKLFLCSITRNQYLQQVKALIQRESMTVTLPGADDEDHDLLTRLECRSSAADWQRIEAEDHQYRVLKGRERMIFDAWVSGYTQIEIARLQGLSAQRINQLMKGIARKLA